MVKAINDGNSVYEVVQHPNRGPAVRELAPRSDWSEMGESEHFVQFYESDVFLLNSLSGYIGTGLGAGDGCIVVATPAHREGLEKRLYASGLDVAAAGARGQYVSLDAAGTLEQFMADGVPAPDRFAEVIGGVIARAAEGRRHVRIFGEMVELLRAGGNHAAAISLEKLWNDLGKTHSFSLFCAYPINGFGGEALAGPLSDVCASHSRVIPAESYAALADTEDRLRAVALLQQRAESLEAEVAERREVEQQLRLSEIRYRRLFEAASDGILMVDPETHKITDANPSMTTLLGAAREELTGKELWEVGLLKSREASAEAFIQLREKGAICFDHLPLRTGDGQHRDVELVTSIYRTNGHQVIQCNVRDVTMRKQAEAVTAHLAAIVESSDDAIISKSLEGIILSWNKGAERIFGYRAEEVVGRPITILFPPDRADEEPGILERLRRGERIDHYETVRVTKDGRTVDISLTISPIRDRGGRIIAASKIARDITERRQAEAALRAVKNELEAQLEERKQLLAREQAARAEAERANRMKDEFLATVSHELRTPLNAILGWCHMLHKGDPDEATVARALKTIEHSARSQARLVEDILDVSRVITGKLRLNVGPVDVATVINAAVDSVQLAADSKGVHLEVTLDPAARHVMGDPSRLQQVVWNLLSNAIKFTPRGGRVAVRLERAGSDLQISVSDTGSGISQDFLPFIFDRFRQADGTSTRRHGGLGLGLAIVRHLVELHGGTVRADSPGKGGGATFTIRLPLAAAPGQAESQRKDAESQLPDEDSGTPASPLPSLEGVRVLVVDDDQDTLQMLTAMLTEYGAVVEVAASAAEALEILQWYRPDVLVSDLAMPDEDGYSLIGKVRAREAESSRQTPALVLTAYVRVEDRAQALSAGFDLFVPKPVEAGELITAIANLVESGAVSRE
ncbi:MAG TPA: PAS domain S-box protein [Blastocatellia bacterium]|nr:PAS domain S-box protein [Blastocatellia bacterium]